MKSKATGPAESSADWFKRLLAGATSFVVHPDSPEYARARAAHDADDTAGFRALWCTQTIIDANSSEPNIRIIKVWLQLLRSHCHATGCALHATGHAQTPNAGSAGACLRAHLQPQPPPSPLRKPGREA